MSDTSILEAAMIGLQHQLTEVDSQIADIRRKLGIRAPRQNCLGCRPATDKETPQNKRRYPEANG